MTACHSYSPMKTGAILLLEIQKVSKCTTLSPVALKGSSKRPGTHTNQSAIFSHTHNSNQQTCSSLLQRSVHIQLLHKKPNNCQNKIALSIRDGFEAIA